MKKLFYLSLLIMAGVMSGCNHPLTWYDQKAKDIEIINAQIDTANLIYGHDLKSGKNHDSIQIVMFTKQEILFKLKNNISK